MTDIDILTTTYRNVDKLKVCLSTVLERTKFVSYKWWLGVNDYCDEIDKVIYNAIYIDGIRRIDRVVPIYNDNNLGSFSSNNNELAEEGNSKYILLLNDDVEPLNDNWLLNMKQILDTDPKVGAIGALLVYPDRKRIQHCGVMFSQRTNNLPFHLHYRQSITKFVSVPRRYQAVTGACMLLRREDFEKLGGLSSDYYYGFEDIDLCLKLTHQLGKQIVYVPSPLIHYEGISGTFKQHPKLQENIKTFRERWEGKYLLDEQFYLNNSDFMLYKRKG